MNDGSNANVSKISEHSAVVASTMPHPGVNEPDSEREQIESVLVDGHETRWRDERRDVERRRPAHAGDRRADPFPCDVVAWKALFPDLCLGDRFDHQSVVGSM